MASFKRRDGQSLSFVIGRDEAGIGPTPSDPHFESLHYADPAAKLSPSSPSQSLSIVTSPPLLLLVSLLFSKTRQRAARRY